MKLKSHFFFFTIILLISPFISIAQSGEEELITKISSNTGFIASGGVAMRDFAQITSLVSDNALFSDVQACYAANLGWKVYFGPVLVGVSFGRAEADFNHDENEKIGYNDVYGLFDFGYDVAKGNNWRVIPTLGFGISEADVSYSSKQTGSTVQQYFNGANASELTLIRAFGKGGLLVLTKINRNPESPYYNFEFGLDTEFTKPFGKSSWEDSFGNEISGPNLQEGALSAKLVMSYWF